MVTPSLLAEANVIVNAGEVSVVVFVSDDCVKRRTLLVPTKLIDRPEKVTTPLEAETVLVPLSVPSPV